MIRERVINHFHICCGLGGGGKGFNRSKVQVGNVRARWECLGGVDVMESAVRDFEKLTGVKGTLMDLMSRDQYIRYHGVEPPAGWREVTPEDLRAAAGYKRPDVVFISAPCQGASGLLAEELAKTPKYQALNELTLRCIWLMAEAWADDPVSLLVFENVPRLATRGRRLLDQIAQVLDYHGYASAETAHDCGVIGGLAQSRKRFLMVARHVGKIPSALYQPHHKGLRSVGSLLSRMPMPGDLVNGQMHRIPALQWKTWVRLALVEAGKDWRSLEQFAVKDGYLRDFAIVPEYRSGFLGVHGWQDSTGVIAARSGPTNGAFSVADPRVKGHPKSVQLGVRSMADTSPVVTGNMAVGAGPNAIADPRGSGFAAKYKVVPYGEHAPTVIAGSTTGQGAFAVADPRPGMAKKKGDAYLTGGHYGVVGFDQFVGAVSASAKHDNGKWSVADPRMPKPNDRLTCVIESLDGTWHRPFTTLELAVLQSLCEPEEFFELDGLNDSAWRERIGNAVPPHAAEAIADVMATTILLAEAGETFHLSQTPIWVRNVAMALSVDQPMGVIQ